MKKTNKTESEFESVVLAAAISPGRAAQFPLFNAPLLPTQQRQIRNLP